MLSEPTFETREAQPCAAIPLNVAQTEIGAKAPPLIEEIIGWIGERGMQAGPVYFNYTRMDGGRMDMEVGAPTTSVLKGDARVVTGEIPAGRYVTATYTGHYDGLRAAHEELHKWLAAKGVPPLLDDARARATLLEIYETDPAEEPDPTKWITHIAFRLGD